jgi:hypothetical protein
MVSPRPLQRRPTASRDEAHRRVDQRPRALPTPAAVVIRGPEAHGSLSTVAEDSRPASSLRLRRILATTSIPPSSPPHALLFVQEPLRLGEVLRAGSGHHQSSEQDARRSLPVVLKPRTSAKPVPSAREERALHRLWKTPRRSAPRDDRPVGALVSSAPLHLCVERAGGWLCAFLSGGRARLCASLPRLCALAPLRSCPLASTDGLKVVGLRAEPARHS